MMILSKRWAANVKLYLDEVLIEEKSSSPWRWNNSALQNLPIGSHQIKAVATDNEGHTDEAIISVLVSDSLADKTLK